MQHKIANAIVDQIIALSINSAIVQIKPVVIQQLVLMEDHPVFAEEIRWIVGNWNFALPNKPHKVFVPLPVQQLAILIADVVQIT